MIKYLLPKPNFVPPTLYPDINRLLDTLLSQIQIILSDKLVSLYLYGSLVTGDFDHDISDIDLLAVTSSDLDPAEFDRLQQMHDDIADQNKQWDNRIEIAYLSTAALKTYKSHPSNIAIISPGEPFHTKEAGIDWLINWYIVREKGIPLFGPSPDIIIDPITHEEFIQAVIDQTKDWGMSAAGGGLDHIHSRPYQAYAILTMCRALYAFKNGDQVSKKQAALWAQKELPEWSSLISNALAWREAYREQDVDHAATLPETVGFVRFVVARVTIPEEIC